MRRSIALSLTVGICLALAALACPSIGWAALITDSPNLPPLAGAYVGEDELFAVYGMGIFLKDVVQHSYSQSWPPPAPGLSDVHSFGELIDGQISFDNGATFLPFSTPAQETDRITSVGDVGNVRDFDTEMLQLDVWGGMLPPGMMFRESPTMPSLGHTTITDIGGGNYHIDSFFDVFTELSVDGGQTWMPSLIAPARMTLVPEPSSLVLLAAGLLALACLRRRIA